MSARRRRPDLRTTSTEQHELAGSDGERDAEAKLTLKSVAAAIDDLSDDQREVLLLTCVEDLTYRETAEMLGIPIGTVMSRLARARTTLAQAAGITGPPPRSVEKREKKKDG